jgi:hypothetical protein
MRGTLLTATISVGLFLFSAQATYANPADSARVLEDKAISYANRYANEPNPDIKIAAHDISQDAIMLGKSYSQSYGLRVISSAECLDEVTKLGVDSETFTQNALAGKYKTIVVNGNIVMLIAASAGTLTYTVLDKGNYCNIEKSTNDAYWTAYIFRLALGGINITFS